MTREAIAEFFDRQREFWRARDAAALARCHSDDGVIVSPIFRTVTGAEAIRESYQALFQIFPDWDYRSEALLIDGDHAAEPFTATATHIGEFMGIAGTRRKFEIRGVRLFELRDGRIAHERRYYDFTGLLIQLGVLKSKPAAG
jgi:steroid delta-isomerase-like uncharacterized protein